MSKAKHSREIDVTKRGEKTLMQLPDSDEIPKR